MLSLLRSLLTEVALTSFLTEAFPLSFAWAIHTPPPQSSGDGCTIPYQNDVQYSRFTFATTGPHIFERQSLNKFHIYILRKYTYPHSKEHWFTRPTQGARRRIVFG